ILDKKKILPSITLLNGEYGYQDLFLGVPTILGGNGVESIIELPLTDVEKDGLSISANAVKSVKIGRASCRERVKSGVESRAEDGIRDRNVTGVQTCALPILILDKKKILPSITLLNGEYGYQDLFLGVPTILGGNGVESIIELPLTDVEKDGLSISANAVKSV